MIIDNIDRYILEREATHREEGKTIWGENRKDMSGYLILKDLLNCKLAGNKIYKGPC